MSPGPAWMFGFGGIMGIGLMIGVFAFDAYGNFLAKRAAARKNKHPYSK